MSSRRQPRKPVESFNIVRHFACCHVLQTSTWLVWNSTHSRQTYPVSVLPSEKRSVKDWVTQEAYDQLLLHNHQVKTNSVRMQHENHFYHLNIPQRFSRYEIGRNFCSISRQNSAKFLPYIFKEPFYSTINISGCYIQEAAVTTKTRLIQYK